MRKIYLLIAMLIVGKLSAQDQLSHLTIGVGIGANHLFNDVYDYSLTTDSSHKLKIEPLKRNNFVVSPVLVFRIKKLTKEGGVSKSSRLINSDLSIKKAAAKLILSELEKEKIEITNKKLKPKPRWTILNFGTTNFLF
jgi:hypothetical protein